MENLVADVINHTFLTHPGKFQCKRDIPEAFLVEFRTRTDYATEEGYRYADLALYASGNYVQVWVRTRWNVIALEDLDHDNDCVKPGKDYLSDASDWKCIGDHDSCWRDSVRDFLYSNKGVITSFDGIGSWFKVVPVGSLNLPEKCR